MSKLIIEIDLDNDAFQDWNGQSEVARILNGYANVTAEYGVSSRKLRDINGNTVGAAIIELDEYSE